MDDGKCVVRTSFLRTGRKISETISPKLYAEFRVKLLNIWIYCCHTEYEFHKIYVAEQFEFAAVEMRQRRHFSKFPVWMNLKFLFAEQKKCLCNKTFEHLTDYILLHLQWEWIKRLLCAYVSTYARSNNTKICYFNNNANDTDCMHPIKCTQGAKKSQTTKTISAHKPKKIKQLQLSVRHLLHSHIHRARFDFWCFGVIFIWFYCFVLDFFWYILVFLCPLEISQPYVFQNRMLIYLCDFTIRKE